ncbi:MAG: BspA family leucine-rich repeat surface protein, partial [Oscillibacter sp.]|nr:BspA family leucine-rich repeat surface protein [Oscillibacter sp.]
LKELAVSDWDTTSLTDIGGIFGDTGITTMDLSKWNTYGFTDVHGVFTDCAALTEVRVNNWDTSMVTTFAATFRNCTGLTEVDLSGWDTSKGANLAQMFMGCENLKTILVSERFVTPNATLVENMFTGCASLVGGAGTKYNAERTDNAYARIDSPDAPGYFTLAGAETPEAYVVSFNANGGGGSMDSVTVIKGGSFTLPQNGFSAPSQKKFRIWAVGNIEYAPGSVLTVNAPVTVTAQWENASASAQGCYVATSVYGSYDCPEVWTLRRFRDNVLAKTWYGRLFIRFYYAVSPTAVRLFGDCEWFQNFFRGRLDKMVDGLQSSGFASTPYQDKDW